MAYRLVKPYSETQKIEFIVEHNHKKGLRIEETENCIFALEDNEIMNNGEPVVDEAYEEKQNQIEANRVKLLSMTKLDFFKYVLAPAGIEYSDLQSVLDENPNMKVAWELCSRVYRGDENLAAWAESAGVSASVLDEKFKIYGE